MNKAQDVNLFFSYAFQDGAPVYLFTNENIYGTLKTTGNVSNKKILTVGASGDHAFESYLLGASNVHTFDINSNQKNVIELKNHMIRGLPYDNFMDFFFSRENFFNQKILTPIKSKFSDDLCKFLKKCNGVHMRRNFKYCAALSSDYDINNLQYIANQSNYNVVRDRLPEQIPFAHCDISKLNDNKNTTKKTHATFTEKYDLVLLSNIFSYLYFDSLTMSEKLLNMHLNVLEPLITNNVSESGRVYFHYLWGTEISSWVNFLHYFQTKNKLTADFFARAVNGAYRDHKYDVVLYATHRQR